MVTLSPAMTFISSSEALVLAPSTNVPLNRAVLIPVSVRVTVIPDLWESEETFTLISSLSEGFRFGSRSRTTATASPPL